MGNREELKFWIGDIVYFIEHWTDSCHKARVLNINKTHEEGIVYAELEDLTIPGETGCKIENVYLSEEECNNAIKAKEDAQKQEYLNSIKSVEDLVRFMYSHHVSTCGEYTDWCARSVVREKAKELLNIDLEEKHT